MKNHTTFPNSDSQYTNKTVIFWTIGQFEFEYFGGSDDVNKL